MICPGCKGNKQACIEVGDAPEAEAKFFGWYTCSRCAGTGEVTPELDAAWLTGHAARQARIFRKEGIRDAARRLGITIAQLCDFENGRVCLPAALTKESHQ